MPVDGSASIHGERRLSVVTEATSGVSLPSWFNRGDVFRLRKHLVSTVDALARKCDLM